MTTSCTAARTTDVLKGEGGNDVLTGPAKTYRGGDGNDTIVVSFTGATIPDLLIDGGADVDRLVGTFGATGEKIELTKSGDTAVLMSYGPKGATLTDLTLTSVEKLNLDAGAGADEIVVNNLNGSPVTELTVDFGRTATVNGTKLETIENKDTSGQASSSTFTREVPDIRYSDDGAKDTLLVRGGDGADSFTLTNGLVGDDTPSEDATGTLLTTSLGYGIAIANSVRGEGDTLTLETLDGNDSIDAADMTIDTLALLLVTGSGADTVEGSPFADVINSGAGSDTVTGGEGRDVFIDAGGSRDTLKETFDRDFFLSDDLFVVGKVTTKTPGTGFTSGVVEDLAGIFEIVELTGGTGGNTFLIGDADGSLGVPGGIRSVSGWTGDVTVNGEAGDDLVVVASRGYALDGAEDLVSGAQVHVVAGTGTDTLYLDGTVLREDVVVDIASGKGLITSTEWTTEKRDRSMSVDHTGLDNVVIRSFGGDDRILVRKVAAGVPHTIESGTGNDEIVVGDNAGFGTGAIPTVTNTNSTLDDIDSG